MRAADFGFSISEHYSSFRKAKHLPLSLWPSRLRAPPRRFDQIERI
jgi:hypothetical protein